MKVIKEATVGGKLRVTVDLDIGEKLLSVHEDRYYSLGHPIEDVVPAHVVADSVPVSWCPVEQKWVS